MALLVPASLAGDAPRSAGPAAGIAPQAPRIAPEAPRAPARGASAPVGEPAGRGPGLAAPLPAETDPGTRLRLMLHGGLSGLGGDGLHAFGGVEGGAMWGRFGAAAVAQLGSGNDFRSTLLAGGPAVEVAEVRRAAIVAHAGPVRYVERIEAGFTRRLLGAYGALSVRIPLGRGAVGFGATVWHGAARGEGIDDPASVTGHRFHLGIGL